MNNIISISKIALKGEGFPYLSLSNVLDLISEILSISDLLFGIILVN